MIPIKDVEQLHRILIDKFGGLHGIRDRATLESVIARPFQIFDGLGFTTSKDNKYEFVIDIASGTHKYEGIVNWLASNTANMNDR